LAASSIPLPKELGKWIVFAIYMKHFLLFIDAEHPKQYQKGGIMIKQFISILFVAGMLFAGGHAEAVTTKTEQVNTTQTITLTATIMQIDALNGNVVVKDQNGKLWEITVPSQAGIDLSAFKVGDKVSATVAGITTSSDSVMRARITKTQLIKLQ
jgi:hypothetical protein